MNILHRKDYFDRAHELRTTTKITLPRCYDLLERELESLLAPPRYSSYESFKNCYYQYLREKLGKKKKIYISVKTAISKPKFTAPDAILPGTPKLTVEDIARTFDIPPHVISLMDSINPADLEQLKSGFVSNFLNQWLKKTNEDSDLITRQEVKNLLKVKSTATIDNLTNKGVLKKHYIGTLVRFKKSEVLAIINTETP